VLQTLDPATAMRGGASAEVYIESLVADLKTFPLHDDPVVPALTRDVQIDYTTPNFTAPEKARFRYRLRGFDQDWKDAGTRRQAFYTHLPPRQYDFEVMTANSTGNWSANSATLRFAVAPALYQTLWFKILIAIALVLFAALFLALRIRQAQEKLRHRMEARNAERERIARDLHDTLLQGIHALAFRLETWATDPEIPMVQKREIETATSQTRSIIEEGREKILELRQTLARASDIAETLVASASVYSNGGHGSVLGVEVSGRARPLTAEAYEQLTAIGAEAIRNAYRHSGADIITFRLSYRRRALEMAIVDNGRGMTAAAQAEPGHYGMTGMRERATLLGATLTIESAPRRGTTIRIAVSRDAAYEL
jgi:signal transduction histidine kinase